MSTAKEKITLITGASSGIGESLARLHAKAGESLLLIARREDRLRELKRELEEAHDVSVHIMGMDLTELGAVDRILARLDSSDLVVEHLINNAGFGGQGRFEEIEWSRHASMIQLNVMVLTELTRKLLPGMVERGYGRLLHVSSTAALVPGPLQAVYYATKAYELSLSEALSEELRGTGVTSTALCPGPVNTGFAQEAGVESMPMFRMAATPDKVAKVGRDGMMKGKRVVSEVSALVWAQQKIVPFVPRGILLRSIHKMQDVESAS